MDVQSPEMYDVIFVSHTGGTPAVAGMIAEKVDKDTAIEHAKRYCHRSATNEGVMIAFHGTTRSPQGSEWWFSC